MNHWCQLKLKHLQYLETEPSSDRPLPNSLNQPHPNPPLTKGREPGGNQELEWLWLGGVTLSQ